MPGNTVKECNFLHLDIHRERHITNLYKQSFGGYRYRHEKTYRIAIEASTELITSSTARRKRRRDKKGRLGDNLEPTNKSIRAIL